VRTPKRPLRAVFFDLGETLVSEDRAWEAWADWLGVPRERLFAVMRTVIERGEHHRRIFESLRPGFDVQAEEAKRAAAGIPTHEELYGFYPDALSCLATASPETSSPAPRRGCAHASSRNDGGQSVAACVSSRRRAIAALRRASSA
jgi:hypothetical protein